MPKTHEVRLITFDAKHNRSNPLFHQAMILIEKDTDTNEETVIDSYGFYSHGETDAQVKGGMITSILKDFPWIKNLIGVNFRLEGSYIELKQEPISELLTQGVQVTQSQKMTPKEYLNFRLETAYILEHQQAFFREADLLWLKALGISNVNLEEEYQKNIAHITEENELTAARKRVEVYEKLVEVIILKHLPEQSDFRKEGDIDWNEINKLRIMKREECFIDDTIESYKKPEEYNFSIIRESKMCKTLMCRLLEKSFKKDSVQANFFYRMVADIFTRNVPRWTPGQEKVLMIQPAPTNGKAFSKLARGGTLVQLEYDWERKAKMIDMSHHVKEKEALYYMRAFLMALDSSWYSERIDKPKKIDRKEIKFYVDKIYKLINENEANFKTEFDEFMREISKRPEGGFNLFEKLDMANQYYQKQRQSKSHVSLPQDITAEASEQLIFLKQAVPRDPQPIV